MGLKNIDITEKTTFWLTVQIKTDEGDPKSLVGATFTASLANLQTQLAGVVTVISPGSGLVKIKFPVATAMAGYVIGSLHMTQASETQCVWRERFTVFTDME